MQFCKCEKLRIYGKKQFCVTSCIYWRLSCKKNKCKYIVDLFFFIIFAPK